MSEDATLFLALGALFVILPFLIAVVITRHVSLKAVIYTALSLLAVLLLGGWWIYHSNVDSGYGPFSVLALYLMFVAAPIFLSAVIAMMIGQWLRSHSRRAE